ncbi:MAG: hypothetical protein OES47_13115 [Acidobacteriota bacterium]|nr:hypothetical protein [Acidobacteriota bacterium]
MDKMGFCYWEIPKMDFVIFVLFAGAWILLQHVVLPKLGVPT